IGRTAGDGGPACEDFLPPPFEGCDALAPLQLYLLKALPAEPLERSQETATQPVEHLLAHRRTLEAGTQRRDLSPDVAQLRGALAPGQLAAARHQVFQG